MLFAHLAYINEFSSCFQYFTIINGINTSLNYNLNSGTNMRHFIHTVGHKYKVNVPVEHLNIPYRHLKQQFHLVLYIHFSVSSEYFKFPLMYSFAGLKR